MNLPNYLTILRIVLSFLCLWLILKNNLPSLVGAFVIFIFASLTDFLDGFLARKKKLVSDLGKLLDPIADKILIMGVFLGFLQLGRISAWMLLAIFFREFLITGLRLYALNKGVVLEAKSFGKHKTVSQILGIYIIFISLIIVNLKSSSAVENFLYYKLIPLVMVYIVVVTLISGFLYLWRNRKIIKTF